MRRLETHYRDLCDIEFTVERGKLWMLQTRVGKRTAAAAFRIAAQLVDEQLITLDEALERVTGEQLARLMFPQFDRSAPSGRCWRKGLAASPGAAVGRRCSTPPTAVARHAAGESVILVRRETNPDDLEGMIAAAGVLTSRGGKTSHAAVVARGMGRTCVCGAEAIDVDAAARTARRRWTCRDRRGRRDRHRRLDRRGVPRRRAGRDLAGRATTWRTASTPRVADADEETADLVRAVDRILGHADATRRLRVRANADTAEDAARARRLGAQGIGLCRTEHMFLGDRRVADRAPGPRRLRRGRATPRWRRWCRCSATTSSSCSRRWTGCR